MEDEKTSILNFNLPKQEPTIIKVIGVGGGGGNAVNHMYNEGIHNVAFVVCNTDRQALESSPIPVHLQLGKEGLGAGNRPERARAAAEESIEDIRGMLNDGTKMVFITAGMGGGTGTGAAPIIAREAKALDILTVGIVTIPFRFEGNRKIDQALDGLEEMQKQVDALLVINNERLREIFTNLTVLEAFAKADDTLSVAAKSIAEIITLRGEINLDFRDVSTVLKDGGVAIMSTAYGEGEGRVSKAIEEALNSPLLNHSDIFKSKKVLLNICFCKEKEGESLMMEEMNEVHEFMSKFEANVEVKFGMGTDPTLGKKVKITILATGFGLSDVLSGVEGADKYKQVVVDEEEEERKRARREIFYNYEKGAKVKRRYKLFRFSKRTLDDDDVISMVETSPTYKRDNESLRQIKDRVEEINNRNAEEGTEILESDGLTINFK
ncbi:MAG: cell division protein FtsZ [Bacteroidaceae bacterium]|jgi:cell division protein FtsZ|nr:cell division protein FtsZ [Bacteroidaceae bacterium]